MTHRDAARCAVTPSDAGRHAAKPHRRTGATLRKIRRRPQCLEFMTLFLFIKRFHDVKDLTRKCGKNPEKWRLARRFRAGLGDSRAGLAQFLACFAAVIGPLLGSGRPGRPAMPAKSTRGGREDHSRKLALCNMKAIGVKENRYRNCDGAVRGHRLRRRDMIRGIFERKAARKPACRSPAYLHFPSRTFSGSHGRGSSGT